MKQKSMIYHHFPAVDGLLKLFVDWLETLWRYGLQHVRKILFLQSPPTSLFSAVLAAVVTRNFLEQFLKVPILVIVFVGSLCH